LTFVSANGVDIWVEQRGSGPDLLLLCGLGDAHDAWAHQLDSYASRFRVTAMDNRGVGRSSLPDAAFNVADMAIDAARVLEHFGIARAHVAGFSMGGAIAQELALARPDLVASLILVNTWCRTNAFERELFDTWAWTARRAENDAQFVRSMLLWVYTRRAHVDGSIERWVEAALCAEHPQSTDAFVRTCEAIAEHDTRDRLHEIGAPALVIAGDEDLIFPPAVQRDLAAQLPNARLELMAGEAHQPFQEAPEAFDAIVLDFISGLRA
jgi:pimeloyl-ACP methyl ester carboxylesterase